MAMFRQLRNEEKKTILLRYHLLAMVEFIVQLLLELLAIWLWWVVVRLLVGRSGVPFGSRGTHFLASSITGISGGQLYRTGTTEQPTPALVCPSIRSCRHSPCA